MRTVIFGKEMQKPVWIKKRPKYTLKATQGQGTVVVGEYSTLIEALAAYEERKDEAAFAIVKPDGTNLDWKVEYPIIKKLFTEIWR